MSLPDDVRYPLTEDLGHVGGHRALARSVEDLGRQLDAVRVVACLALGLAAAVLVLLLLT